MIETKPKVQKLRYLPVSDIYISDTLRISKREFKREGFIGFDTETYKGACKLICTSKGNYVYNPTFRECIEVLWSYANKNYYRAFWNIDFDISSILKLWNNIEKIDDLIHGKKVEYEEFVFYYIRPRMFQIIKGHKTIYFTDLFAMYQMALEKASSKYLNSHKIDAVDPAMLNTDLEYWDENLDIIIEYCIRDAELTAELGEFLMKTIEISGLKMPKFFTSHASLSKQYFRFNCKIPQIKFVPSNILDIAFQCYYGGRFEVLQKGYFKELYHYDINSAYPNIIRQLPSLKYGKWEKVKKISKKECIGFYKVALDIKEKHISPFPIRHKNLVIFPNGIFITWITWFEADLLRKSIDKIYYGYEYKPSNKEYYPFFLAMDKLYKEKTKYKGIDDTLYWFIKVPMNALYGCFVERHLKEENITTSGILFNSVYGAIITAKTRYKLLHDIKPADHKYIVGFHTDSIISTKPLDLSISNKIGDWTFENEKESNKSGVVLKSGIYQIGKESKRRGFFSKKSINWLELLEKRKYKDNIKYPYTKVMKIAECLKRFHSIDQVNMFIETHKRLYINGDKKRVWKRDFKDCNDVLHSNISSKPIELYYIRNDDLK